MAIHRFIKQNSIFPREGVKSGTEELVSSCLGDQRYGGSNDYPLVNLITLVNAGYLAYGRLVLLGEYGYACAYNWNECFFLASAERYF